MTLLKVIGWFCFLLALGALGHSGVVQDRRFTTGYKGNKLPIPMAQRFRTAGLWVAVGIVLLVAAEISDSVLMYWPILWRVACCLAVAAVAWVVFPNLVAGHQKWGIPENVALGRVLTSLAVVVVGVVGILMFVQPNPPEEAVPSRNVVASSTTPVVQPAAVQALPSKPPGPVATAQPESVAQPSPQPAAETRPSGSDIAIPGSSVMQEAPARVGGPQPSAQRMGCLKFAAAVASTANMRDRGKSLQEAQQLVSARLVAETSPELSQRYMDYVASIFAGHISAFDVEAVMRRNCAGL